MHSARRESNRQRYSAQSLESRRPREVTSISSFIGPIGLREAVRRLGKAQDILAREINPVVWTARELEKRRRTADPFLRRILSGPLLSVKGPPLNAMK